MRQTPQLSLLQFFLFTVCVVIIPLDHALAQCLSPELARKLTIQRDLGGIPLYAVPEAETERIDHIEDMLTQLLYRNDQSEGQIRQNMIRANLVFLIFKDATDYKRFEDEVESQSRECPRVPILAVEIHYPGSPANRAGMVDESFNDIAEHVYYYGVKSAYPDWDARLHVAQREAHANGRFFPLKAFEPDPEKAWNAIYLVTGMEVYYGLWEGKRQARRGEMPYSTRAQLRENDPVLVELIEELFPADITLKPAGADTPGDNSESTEAPH